MSLSRFLEPHRNRALAAIVLAGAWWVALLLPASLHAGKTDLLGWEVLVLGWLGFLIPQPAWVANLVLWIVLPILATSQRSWRRTLRICGFVLIGCGVAAMFWTKGYADSGTYLIAWGIGFYFWMAAVIGGGLAAVVTSRVEQFAE